MGEEQSKEAEHQPKHHGSSEESEYNSMTPSQRAFLASFESEKKIKTFPLMKIKESGQEYEFMDIRVNEELGPKEKYTGRLNYEILWSGELEGLDQAAFKARAMDVLGSYGAEANGRLHDCGMMVSIIALPFSILEDDAMCLGRAMFGDFGVETIGTDDQNRKNPHNSVVIDSDKMTPSQRAFSNCFKSKKKNESFPLMTMIESGQEYEFMDVRGNDTIGPIDKDTGMLNYEMFWSGELEGLDQYVFKTLVMDVLDSYGAEASGELRECGCMISMVALPFSLSEDGAMSLGKDMFGDFGELAKGED